MTVTTVIPSYMNKMMQRYVQMVEATLRTEALLLGEEHYSATPALEWMIRDAKPKIGYKRDEMVDAFAYAMQYGIGVHQAIAPITGRVRSTLFDDYISARNMSRSLLFEGTAAALIPLKVEEATPPRASMAWPSSHQGKKGPAPHKPFRK